MQGRIVINPKVLTDDRDALAVAYNEAYRAVMEANDFVPKAEPTPEQQQFFADTAYATDPLMMKRTIVARIATYDASVPNPTSEQYQDTIDMLHMVQSAGVISNPEEEEIVSSTLADMEDQMQMVPQLQPAPDEAPLPQMMPGEGDMGGGMPGLEQLMPPEGAEGMGPEGVGPEGLAALMGGAATRSATGGGKVSYAGEEFELQHVNGTPTLAVTNTLADPGQKATQTYTGAEAKRRVEILDRALRTTDSGRAGLMAGGPDAVNKAYETIRAFSPDSVKSTVNGVEVSKWRAANEVRKRVGELQRQKGKTEEQINSEVGSYLKGLGDKEALVQIYRNLGEDYGKDFAEGSRQYAGLYKFRQAIDAATGGGLGTALSADAAERAKREKLAKERAELREARKGERADSAPANAGDAHDGQPGVDLNLEKPQSDTTVDVPVTDPAETATLDPWETLGLTQEQYEDPLREIREQEAKAKAKVEAKATAEAEAKAQTTTGDGTTTTQENVAAEVPSDSGQKGFVMPLYNAVASMNASGEMYESELQALKQLSAKYTPANGVASSPEEFFTAILDPKVSFDEAQANGLFGTGDPKSLLGRLRSVKNMLSLPKYANPKSRYSTVSDEEAQEEAQSLASQLLAEVGIGGETPEALRNAFAASVSEAILRNSARSTSPTDYHVYQGTQR